MKESNPEFESMKDEIEDFAALIRKEAEGLEPVRSIFPDTEKAAQLILQEQDRLRKEIIRLRKEIQETKQNSYYWDLGGGIKGFLRRAVRAANKCILYPINERQNAFNDRMDQAAGLIHESMENQQKFMENLNDRIRLQQEQLSLIRYRLSRLESSESRGREKDIQDREEGKTGA